MSTKPDTASSPGKIALEEEVSSISDDQTVPTGYLCDEPIASDDNLTEPRAPSTNPFDIPDDPPLSTVNTDLPPSPSPSFSQPLSRPRSTNPFEEAEVEGLNPFLENIDAEETSIEVRSYSHIIYLYTI